MRNKSSPRSHKLDVAEKELVKATEVVLQLQPTDADKLVRANPVLATSMSGKQILRESRHEAQLEAEVRASATSLNLNPTDIANRVRVTGGSTMGNKVTRIASSAENLAVQEYNRTSTEELKIDPNIQATRVGMPSASALASKETRLRTNNEERVETELRLSEEEVLNLQPELTAASSKKRIKTASSMANTQERFATLKEEQASTALRNIVEPEALLLSPTDTGVRKNQTGPAFGGSSGGGAKGTTGATGKRTGNTSTAASSKGSTLSSAGNKQKTAISSATAVPSTTKTTATKVPPASKQPASLPSAHDKDDQPGTPVVTAPQISGKPPGTGKAESFYNNLSNKDVNSIIDNLGDLSLQQK